MPPFLPPELLEAIVNESGAAQYNLSKIMLVSRYFRVSALRHQFKKCIIRVSTTRQLTRIQALRKIITSPLWPAEESVPRHIQTLEVELKAYEEAKNVRHSLVSIFNALFRNPALLDCSIEISGNSGYNFSLLESDLPDVVEALYMACVRPNLSYLSISGIKNIPPSFCSSLYISELSLLNSASFCSAPLEDASPSPGSSDGRFPLSNLRSLTYDCEDGLMETIITKNRQLPYLASLTYICPPIRQKKLYADFHQFGGPALTTLTINLFNVCIGNYVETDTLQYDLLPQLSSLTIHARKQWGTNHSDTPSLFSCITRFLPPHPTNRKLEINLNITGAIRCEHGYAYSSNQALLKCFQTIGEMELVRYWKNFYFASTDMGSTGSSLNVRLRLLMMAVSYSARNPTVYFTSLFDGLRNTKGVSLQIATL